jgi:tripartite-type tricarboxylate transporter receptor subunit TctC
MMPHFESGTLRFLAQSSETRSPTLPNVPTFQEAGFKDMVLVQWFGVFAPAGTPPDIVGRLNAEFAKAMTDDKVRASMLKAANEPVGGTPEQFGTLVRNDSAKYARLAKELGIKGE